MTQQGWGDGNANSGVYDGGQNQTPSSTGVILHERVLPQAPANETIRQTGVQSSSDPTVFSADVSIRDANGNPFSASNPLPVAASPTLGTLKSFYNEVTSVAASSLTTVLTYTVPTGKTVFIQKVVTSGTNIAEYSLYLNGVIQDKRRTNFGGDLNAEFGFAETAIGLPVAAGDIILIKAIHNRTFLGDFNARIQVIEI